MHNDAKYVCRVCGLRQENHLGAKMVKVHHTNIVIVVKLNLVMETLVL